MSVLMVESKFRSGDGINGVYYAKWCDDAKKPKAILQIAHGMCEYIARYKGFAEFMTQNGYVVFGNDHLGHGHTAKSDSELGYFAKKDGYRLLVSDMHKLTEIAKEEYPGLPLILLGHSMGSFLARLWAATYPKEADAFIFMGTSGANPLGAVGIFLVNVISIFKGERHRSNFINFMSFGSYT
ncbi:MAG: alpha/beta fold hydrolase, partial [Oscillospiraceae bacterium]